MGPRSLSQRYAGAAGRPVAAVLCLAAPAALACSGPGAQENIRQATVVGWVLAGVAGLLFLVATAGAVRARRRETWLGLAVAALVLAVHPAWWLSARNGDCGSMRVTWSVAGTVLLASLAWLIWAAGRNTAHGRRAS